MKAQKVIGIISLVLVAGVLGFTIYSHFARKKSEAGASEPGTVETV
jgi:hypothetical protein